VLHDFLRKPDAPGNMGIHPLQRITGSLRVLGYGYVYDAVDELIGIADSTMALTLRSFWKAVMDEFGPEYLRELNEGDMRRILAVNESPVFPGNLGSIDCQHWNERTAQWLGQASSMGKEKKPTMTMEAILDGEVWIWHISVGHAGSITGQNIGPTQLLCLRLLFKDCSFPYNRRGLLITNNGITRYLRKRLIVSGRSAVK
jgi:Plant transposon protein